MLIKKERTSREHPYRCQKTLPLVMVTTPFEQFNKHYLERAALVLGEDQKKLPYDVINRCKRRAAIKSAPDAQVLHDHVHNQGVRVFVDTVRSLNGTI